MKKFATAISSGFGAGFIPLAPGTWGTAVATLFMVILWSQGFDYLNSYPFTLTIVFSLLGYWAIIKLQHDWEHDDQRIVVDEMIGLWITLFFVPINGLTLVLSFVLFRFFDIVKPLGIRHFDNINTNWAVIVDDMLAGVYANISLQLILLALSWR